MKDKIIAAYSIADMEEHYAEFGRGKDRKKRKSRAGLYAAGGVGAGALGGAGYGASVAARVLKKNEPGMGNTNLQNSTKRVVERDVERVKDIAKKAGNWLGNPINKAKAAYQSSDIIAASGKSQNAKIRSTGSLGNKLRQTGDAIKNVAGTRAGKIGAGLALAGALGGAGYGAYRAMKGKKKK